MNKRDVYPVYEGITPPDSGDRPFQDSRTNENLPCPHGRASWHHCPHCLGLNAPIALTPMPPPEHFATVAISLDLAPRDSGKEEQ